MEGIVIKLVVVKWVQQCWHCGHTPNTFQHLLGLGKGKLMELCTWCIAMFCLFRSFVKETFTWESFTTSHFETLIIVKSKAGDGIITNHLLACDIQTQMLAMEQILKTTRGHKPCTMLPYIFQCPLEQKQSLSFAKFSRDTSKLAWKVKRHFWRYSTFTCILTHCNCMSPSLQMQMWFRSWISQRILSFQSSYFLIK